MIYNFNEDFVAYHGVTLKIRRVEYTEYRGRKVKNYRISLNGNLLDTVNSIKIARRNAKRIALQIVKNFLDNE